MLLETVIALGIVAFALVPMIGLLPIGMNAYRDSIDRTMSSRIVQQIFGEFAVGASPSSTQPTRFFDFMGQETSSASAVETIYTVNVVTSTSKLPGDQDTDRALCRVNVEVWHNPAHLAAENRAAGAGKQQIRDYSFEVCY